MYRFNYEWTGNVAETGDETAIPQMNARTVVSVLAIYSHEQKVTYRDAVMKERQKLLTTPFFISRHKMVMQLPFFLYDTEYTRLRLITAFRLQRRLHTSKNYVLSVEIFFLLFAPLYATRCLSACRIISRLSPRGFKD